MKGAGKQIWPGMDHADGAWVLQHSTLVQHAMWDHRKPGRVMALLAACLILYVCTGTSRILALDKQQAWTL